MVNVKEIADAADMIINGYAFTKQGDYIRVLNLNCVSKAAVIRENEIIETNMDDIEMDIVLDYYMKNKKIHGGLKMPKYFEYKICGYYLYYTSHCVIEAMHVHASDERLTEAGSAKFFVMKNGDTTIEKKGQLKSHEINKIQAFIKEHYKEMYLKWQALSNRGFYGE